MTEVETPDIQVVDVDAEERKQRFYTTRPPRPPRIDRKKHLSMEIQQPHMEAEGAPAQRDELNVHFLSKTQQVVRERILSTKDPASIDLSDCNLSQIPKVIFSDTPLQTTLRELNLSHNKLTSLPSSINLLIRLVVLDCAFNRLTDLPLEIADLPALEHLHLAGNPLHNELKQKTLLGTPAVVQYLKSQQRISLAKTSSGTIRKRDRIKDLFIHHSHSNGAIPHATSNGAIPLASSITISSEDTPAKSPPPPKTPTHGAPLSVPPTPPPAAPPSPPPSGNPDEEFGNPLIIQMKLGLEASIGFNTTNREANNKFKSNLTDPRGVQFKFNSYCNSQFAELRSLAGIDTETYRASLQSVTALGFSGKSGSVLLRSADNLLVLKTISREESSFLRRILSQYNEYMKSNPNTTLARFWGLYKVVKGPLVRVSFIVMKNAFSSGLKIHERYDLKGSRIGRHSGEENIRLSRVMLKDLDLTQMNRRIRLGPTTRKAFIDQITSDCKFLEKFDIIDYSLILGIHYFEDWPTADGDGADTTAQREAEREFRKSYPEKLFGEIMGKSETSDLIGEMYFMTIIDMLQPYNLRKQLEYGVKSIRYGDDISVIPPSQYASRFVAFITAVVD